MKVRFNATYFVLAIVLFIVEVLIALYVNDSFVRPYFGDFLVVILIYCFVQSFVKLPIIVAAIGTLLFSYLIETLQYVNLVERLGLQHSRLATTVIGHSFAWADIVAYTAGVIFVVLVEWQRKRWKRSQ